MQEGSIVVLYADSIFFTSGTIHTKPTAVDGFWLAEILNIFNINIKPCEGSDLMVELSKSADSYKIIISESKTGHLLVES